MGWTPDAATLAWAAEQYDELQTVENDHYSRRDPALWLHNLASVVEEAS